MPKQFDQVFKAIAEGDPRGLLDLFGSLPLDAEARVQTVEREQLGEPLYVDQAYLVETEGKTWVEHFEVTTRVPPDMKDRMAKYGFTLAMGYKLPVRSSLVLLSPRHSPKILVPRHKLDLGTVKIEIEFRVIKLWQIDGGKILAAHRPRLLPFVPLAESTGEQIAMAAKRIGETGSITLKAAFGAMGGLRYGKNEWTILLERLPDMWWTEQILRDSSMYEIAVDYGIKQGKKQGLEEGIEKGIEKGKQAGLLAGRRGAIRDVLKLRFPTIGPLDQLDAISNARTLDKLLREAATATKPQSFLVLLRGNAAKTGNGRKRSHR